MRRRSLLALAVAVVTGVVSNVVESQIQWELIAPLWPSFTWKFWPLCLGLAFGAIYWLSADYRSLRRRLNRLEREPENRVAADAALGNRIAVFETRMRGQLATIAAQLGQESGQTQPKQDG